MLIGKRNDYARLKATPAKEFAGGKRGKENTLAYFFGEIQVLQELLEKRDDE